MSFQQAFQIVIGHEGGYVNDPVDPGGETKYGISKRSYPDVDIPNLTLEKAQAIYERDYWLKCGCDKLPHPMNIIIFDSAVNHGCTYAEDLAREKDWKDVLFRRIVKYMAICRKKPDQKRFFMGWMARIISLWSKFV